MISRRSAIRLGAAGLILGAGALLTDRRAAAREAQALAENPATGQFLRVGGLRLHARVAGEGPDLVLIHGASGNLQDLTLPLLASLTPHYRVIAFDRPGHGHSEPLPADEVSLAAQAHHLAQGAARLGAHRPLVLGQSYGGAVALAWALGAPMAGLILVAAPSLPWPGRLDPWYRLTASPLGAALVVPLAAAYVPQSYVSRAITAVFAPDPVPVGYATAIGANLSLSRRALGLNARQVNALRPQLVAMEPRYPILAMPVELLHGTADTIVPRAIHSAPLAPRLPDARLTTIEGAGHMPHHSHPGLVLAAIARAAARARLR